MRSARLVTIVTLLAGSALAAVACGAPDRVAPPVPHDELDVSADESSDEAPADRAPSGEAPRDEARAAEEPSAGTNGVDGADAPPELGAIDHSGTPCFGDPAATRHLISPPSQHPEGSFRSAIRSSVRADPEGQLTARPGDVVRFDVTLENAGTVPLALSELDVSTFRRLSVMGVGANWALPLEVAGGDLRAGHRLEPGGVLRLCLAFDVGRTPIDAAPPSVGTERAYTLDWPTFRHEGLGVSGGYLTTGRALIVVRYPRERGPVLREHSSWGGVIELELAEGASLSTIAREAGVRIGSALPLFRSLRERRQPQAVHVYVQAPPSMRARDAAVMLEARDDVLRARPLFRGDPGTEGCSEHNPCARGQSCCYMCGIDGCPNSCWDGRSCPRGIP